MTRPRRQASRDIPSAPSEQGPQRAVTARVMPCVHAEDRTIAVAPSEPDNQARGHWFRVARAESGRAWHPLMSDESTAQSPWMLLRRATPQQDLICSRLFWVWPDGAQLESRASPRLAPPPNCQRQLSRVRFPTAVSVLGSLVSWRARQGPRRGVAIESILGRRLPSRAAEVGNERDGGPSHRGVVWMGKCCKGVRSEMAPRDAGFLAEGTICWWRDPPIPPRRARPAEDCRRSVLLLLERKPTVKIKFSDMLLIDSYWYSTDRRGATPQTFGE